MYTELGLYLYEMFHLYGAAHKFLFSRKFPYSISVGHMSQSWYFLRHIIIVSPAKQKRDICIAFPASSSSVALTFLCLGHFLGNYKG